MRKKSPIQSSILFILLSLSLSSLQAQVTFPVNGVADVRNTVYAFTHATIAPNADEMLEDATLLIRKDKIIAIGKGIDIPQNAVIIDCKGKYIYPSFIDLYSDYGIEKSKKENSKGDDANFVSNTPGPLSWNEALKPEFNSVLAFKVNEKDAKQWRNAGFGTVLSHLQDGIVRGTGVLVTLADERDNLVVLKEKASANYSFEEGSSSQSYPNSMMGSIALLRQTYLNADWYKELPEDEGKNISLEAWNQTQDLPQIFDAGGKWNDLRAWRIAKEFGVQYIIKGGGDEYQRIKEMAATHSTFILPLDFPEPMDVSNPNDARSISLADLKHWEMAPLNPSVFENANIPFCLTADGLKNEKEFWKNLRKAIEAGLSKEAALNALTRTPAEVLGVYSVTGSLENGKLANFIITDKPLFEDKANILQNWVQGHKYVTGAGEWAPIAATYQLTLKDQQGNETSYTLKVTSEKSAKIVSPDTLSTKFSSNGKLVELVFSLTPKPKKEEKKNKEDADEEKGDDALMRLNGVIYGNQWQGNGADTTGLPLTWTAVLKEDAAPDKKDKDKKDKNKPLEILGKVTYPFGAYGWEQMPRQQDILIKNATVWTSEDDGVLKNTDVFVKNGKIAAIGKDLKNKADVTIDGTGMHLTPGIIDEHSHIATSSINEGGQSVTSEVRIGDNLYPDDINIYRQLSGGVTTSHILHGSANTIGGQTQLIKLRWGVNDTSLKFRGADPFIKFALGENVKRTRSRSNDRFPDTRMGVYKVLIDAFTRASDYEKARKAFRQRGENSDLLPVRRDLELDALVEIMNEKRFITCHSYVQSEILATMKVADSFGFKINTFTHILEGYKVADKMKEHGANASTFSDWWIYKLEVQDAIPQNAGIMHKVGLNVAINSDDAEMARRLNQEAAKSMKYGLSAEEALKMVTLNPAKMLHIDNRVGSIKVGKDADLVLWNHNPLSVYAVAQTTIVDGTIYFDRKHDLELREKIQKERHRLIQKLNGVKKSGAKMAKPKPSVIHLFHCEDHVYGQIELNP